MSAPIKKLRLEQTPVDFDVDSLRAVAELVKSHSGINLETGKDILIQTRLNQRLNKLNISYLSDYVSLIESDSAELQHCIELITTHKTEWFREIVHYQWIQEDLKNKNLADKVQVWSAACSTGLEAYSLLFLFLKEGLKSDQVRILATDISTKILKIAEQQPVTDDFSNQIDRLLTRIPNKESFQWELEKALAHSLKFREFNLVESELPSPIKFDYIFLRNVLIYFDRPTIRIVCRKLISYLKPGGFLILGLSESIQGEFQELKPCGNSIYQLQEARK